MPIKKALVPFSNAKPLVPGARGGLRYWRQERDNQALKDEITELAKVLRRLSQELIDCVLFLRDKSPQTPEGTQRQVIRIMSALKGESAMLTSLFDVSDLHPALQRIFAEKTESRLDLLEQPDIELVVADSPTIKPPKTTLLHMISDHDIEVLTLILAGYSVPEAARKLGVTRPGVYRIIRRIKAKAKELLGEKETPNEST